MLLESFLDVEITRITGVEIVTLELENSD